MVILTQYFAADSKTAGKQVSARHALGLPRGSIRLLLLGGFIGLLAFLWNHSTQLQLPEDSDRLYALIALLLIGFFVGYVLTHVFRSPDGSLPAWLQDVQAWLALLAMLALAILVIVYGVINQSLETVGPLNVDQVEAGLAGLIGFYFGARS